MKKLILAISFLFIAGVGLHAQTATRAVQTASPVIYVDREPAKTVSTTTTTTTTTTATAPATTTTSSTVNTNKTEVTTKTATPTTAAEDGSKKTCCKSGTTGKTCCKSGTTTPSTITPVFSPTTTSPKENH